MIGFLLFFPGIPILWIFGCSLIALYSGWFKLGKQYREAKFSAEKFSAEQHDVERKKEGVYFRGVSGRVGLPFLAASYGTCLHVVVGELGFGLRVALIFRILSPHLYIPWTEISKVTHRKNMFFQSTKIYIKGYYRRITLYGTSGQYVFEKYNEATQA